MPVSKILYSFFLVLLLSILSCESNNHEPVHAEIRKTSDGFELYRDKRKYFIKGARTIGTQYMDKVALLGGNSVRIGSHGDLHAKLDTAHKYGLSVLFGLPVESERNGFDYEDEMAVKEQYERVKAMVNKYKGHPAILMWAIGNEMDYVPGKDYNLKLWDAVNDIAVMIHEIDPFHPAITVTGTGRKHKLEDIIKRLPDIDALGINSYGDIMEIPGWVRKYELNKPYLITEWGPTGHWQVYRNKWGIPVEETSTEKAAMYLKRHQEVIEADPLCLGGYSFLWTQNRQERTHTWYNMFHGTGKETEAVEIMQYLWTGKWPENKAPRIDSLTIENHTKKEDILLDPGYGYTARALAHDPNGDTLHYEWELYPENKEFGYAGHGETRPNSLNELIHNRFIPEITFQSPSEKGDYRLFVYISDNKNKIVLANIPFHVR